VAHHVGHDCDSWDVAYSVRRKDGLVVQYLVGASHPIIAQPVDFLGDPMIAEPQLRASHVNHGVSSEASAKPDLGAAARD
jgi:hypothetical protein